RLLPSCLTRRSPQVAECATIPQVRPGCLENKTSWRRIWMQTGAPKKTGAGSSQHIASEKGEYCTGSRGNRNVVSLASCLSPPSLMYHVQGIEFEIVVLIEPSADEVIEPKARPPGKRQRIHHELGDGLVPHRVRLIVEDMDAAVADLDEIDVAGEGGLR